MPHKNTLNLYIVFGLSLGLTFVPTGLAALLCFIFFTITLVMSYSLRHKAKDDDFAVTHATHIIRTIWVGSTIALISIIIGGVYMFFNVNNDPMMPCAENFLNLAQTGNPSQFTETAIMNIFEPCKEPYLQTNLTIIIITATTMIGPTLVYFIYRYVKGLSACLKTKNLQNPKKWL